MQHKGFSCTFYLIRHAESELNLQSNLIGGRCETTPLSPRGRMQAKSLGERLKKENIHIDFAYASPALRAYATAAISLTQINYPLDKIVKAEELHEIDMGDWEEKPRTQTHNTDTLTYMLRKSYTFTPPNGESQEQVEMRITNWINDNFIYNQDFIKNCNKSVIGIYSHAMTIKTLMYHIMKFDRTFIYGMPYQNTAISEFAYCEKGWIAKRINDSAHLHGIEHQEYLF